MPIRAQTISVQIKWSEPKTYHTVDGRIVSAPYFAGAQVDEANQFAPLYHQLIPLTEAGDVTAQLTDMVYETGSAFSGTLPNRVEPKVTLCFIKKRPYADVLFTPIRRNPANGNIERITTASLALNVSPKPIRKSGRVYASHSALASGSWWKMGVSNTGVYKIDYNYLKNALRGDVSNVTLSTLAVYGSEGGMVPEDNSISRIDDLQELSSYVYDANGNNRMDADDYLLFYAHGPHSWRYNSSSARFEHQFNVYSDKAFYFLTTTQGTGKRLVSLPSATGVNQYFTEFDDYAFHEVDDYNLLGMGRQWFGDRMTGINPDQSFSFEFPNLNTGVPVKVKSRVVAKSPYNSTITLSVNSNTVLTHNVGIIVPTDYPDAYQESNSSGTFTGNSNTLNFKYSFSNPDGSGTSAGYIDYLEVNVKRSLQFGSNQLAFRVAASAGSGNVSQFTIGNAGSNVQVLDVTDPISPVIISGTLNNNQLVVSAPTNELKEFAAIDLGGTFPTPDAGERIENQDLHGTGQPDMLIITSDALLSAANDLASFHGAQPERLKVRVFTTRQIYNEFSGGRQDIAAIRDFVKMMYDRAGSDSTLFPKYVCLLGDGSYDYKDRVPDNNNVVPPYESVGSQNMLDSYVSDDFFVCLDDGENGNMDQGYNKLDVAIGRIVAADNSEAQAIINKIRLYKSPTSLGNWRNIITTIADDEDGNVHQTEANFLADYTQSNYPSFNTEKIFCDAFQQINTSAGDRYPDVNAAILNRISNGTLVISYTGHGGINNWAHERIFNMSDIQNLSNREKLPFFITATCDFTAFDNPGFKTAGEFLYTNPNGGGIALMTTTRPVYSDANDQLQNAMFSKLFEPFQNRKPTMGELATRTKNVVLGTSTKNTRCFVLIGDPALKLNYPEFSVVTTAVNNVNISQPHDTLKALSEVTIAGEVRDLLGNKLTSFNGTCYPLVYDKISSFTTLRNDPSSIAATYQQYKNILFKGKCSVKNGAFQFTFIVPKDINYQIGFGRISYYADNGENIDAHGYQNDIVIGGTSGSFTSDNEGPKIKLYMNDEKFVFGGTTNESPNLLARLRDQSGINTTGNGLGHDLTAVLDLNSKNPIVLNNYYETDKDSFRTGRVLYPLSKLQEGRHNLRIKAWDIHNNSAEDYTEFVVASSAKLALNHVLNYPNPFTTRTNFMFEHNRPGDALQIQVQIYTVSGRLVKTIMREEVPLGYRIDDLTWDGLDDYGDKIGKGTYVYKVHVRDSQGNTANKFEKLVLLR
ncbi:MAG: type IX secretion system sortase PorU [Chitinophagales bacterium]